MSATSVNPFSVSNPEQLDAATIARDFVDFHTDLPQLQEHKNTFILGARGTGKSMLLRSLEPDVMIRRNASKSVRGLPWVGVHVPIKKLLFALPELGRLNGYARYITGEHLLVTQVMVYVVEMLISLQEQIPEADAELLESFVAELHVRSGGQAEDLALTDRSEQCAFRRLRGFYERELARIRQFYVRQPFQQTPSSYSGALTGFLDFLLPVADRIRNLPTMPDAPLFLMIDDADNLKEHLQRVLNSWVSSRSTKAICLKISTQLGYKTYRTMDGRTIENPHDFNEINLSTIYTSYQDRYSNRLREIVAKRLGNIGSTAKAEEFFPEDADQRAELEGIAREIGEERRAGQPASGATRERDDIQRYKVPRLMRRLHDSRSSHTFSYAGFESLVDLSSGVVRWFLEPASRMYARVESQGQGTPGIIPVAIQDEVILDWSRDFLRPLSDGRPAEDDAESDDGDASLHAVAHDEDSYQRLLNLMNGMANVYRARLLDEDATERRLFSFVLSGKPSNQLASVLGMAVRLGYLQKSDYAAKKGFGARLPRYIMARRLAPHYKLDVSGYAAHLSVQAQDLEVVMTDPERFARRRLKEPADGMGQARLDLDPADD